MIQSKKLFYSLREVSKLLGEPSSTIKYWEQEFPQIAPRRSEGGTRQYTQASIDILKSIQSLLRQQGMTIPGAREALRHKGDKLIARQNTLNRLRSTLQRLENLRSALQESMDYK